MELQIKSFLLFVICVFSVSISSAQDNYVENQRELLREYFLYSSLKKAYGGECFRSDFSASYYVDVANYDLSAFHKIDSLATAFVESRRSSSDKSKYETVFLDCMEKYKSEEVKKFICGLDKYLIKD